MLVLVVALVFVKVSKEESDQLSFWVYRKSGYRK